MAETGATPWDVGHRRAGREDGSFSYRNAIVVEAGKRGLSIIVSDTNSGARRLYERWGAARWPNVPWRRRLGTTPGATGFCWLNRSTAPSG